MRSGIEKLGLEFIDVDLRWGVPSKDSNGETTNSWECCRPGLPCPSRRIPLIIGHAC
jgi:hypothetical protein